MNNNDNASAKESKWMSAKSKFDGFLNSQWFMLTFALLVVLSWILALEYILYFFVGVLATYIFFSKKDLKQIWTLVIFSLMAYSGRANYTYLHFVFYLACGIFLVTSIIYKFYMLYVTRTRFKIGGLFVPMLVAILALIMGGIGYKQYEIVNLPVVLGIGLAFLFMYTISVNFIESDLRDFVCKILLLSSLICIFEMIVWYIRCEDITKAMGEKLLNLSWTGPNGIGIIFVMTVIMSLYKSSRKTKYMIAYIAMSMICMTALVFTFSRGAIIALLVSLPIAWTYGYRRTELKRAFTTASLIGIAMVITICVTTVISNSNILILYKKMGLNDNGRIEMYRLAIKTIFEQPLFGCGFLGKNASGALMSWKVYDTPLQIVFSTGVIGFILFAYYYYSRYKLQIEYFSKYKFFALIAVLAFEFYGLFENFFVSVPLNIIVLLVVLACEKETIYIKDLIKNKQKKV